MRPERAPKAFTLLELIVVIVILGILAAIAVPTFANVIEKSRTETAISGAEAVGRNALYLASSELEHPLADGGEHLVLAASEAHDVQVKPGSIDLVAGTAVVVVGETDIEVTLTFTGNKVDGRVGETSTTSPTGGNESTPAVQTVSYDTSYGTGGVTSKPSMQSGHSRITLPLAGGSTLLAGNSNAPVTNSTETRTAPTLVRYDADGNLDQSFGGDGVVVTGDLYNTKHKEVNAAVVVDGKYMVFAEMWDPYAGGGSEALVLRYNSDGSLDQSFGTNGVVTHNFGGWHNEVMSAVVQGDTILTAVNVESYTDGRLIRFNLDGSINSSYPMGKFTPWSLAQLPDGKLLLEGITLDPSFQRQTQRRNADGSLDTSFDGDGILLANVSNFIVQADGKLVGTGTVQVGNDQLYQVGRYNVDGSVDTGFGDGGTVTTRAMEGPDASQTSPRIIQQADGRLLLAGQASVGPDWTANLAVVRYNSDGSLDTSLAGDGTWTSPGAFTSPQYLSELDGKVLMGDGNYTLARFTIN